LYRVLLANPSLELCHQVVEGLTSLGYVVDTTVNGRQCLQSLRCQKYQALLTERDLGDMSAEQVLEQARRRQPELVVVILSEGGGPREAMRLAKLGLDDYLPASLPVEELAHRLREQIEGKLRAAIPGEQTRQEDGPTIIGRSRAVEDVLQTIRLIASKRSTVLISGPTGTGKELAAGLIHALSRRAAIPMVTVNCGAIPETLLEAEFFGHVKGAFTGAVGPRLGRFEQAQGSTLFLDEISELSLALQAKVLRAVQEREFQRVGSSQTVRVDVRVIAATNCELGEKVRRREFREDLYYRLNVVPLRMPGLAERLEDLPLLVEHFLAKVCQQEELPLKRVSGATVDRLMQYHWPGNVRQLENAVEKAVVLSGERGELFPSDFPLPELEPSILTPQGSLAELRLPLGGLDLDALIGQLERSLLQQALRQAAGNKKRAADLLRLKRTTLSAKLRSLQMGSAGGGGDLDGEELSGSSCGAPPTAC